MDNKIVEFTYDGQMFKMSEQEIIAAYYYRLHQFRLQDALRQLNIFVYGCDEIPEEEQDESDDCFQKQYGLSYVEASTTDMLELYCSRFDARFDCNEAENDLWEAAIRAVLEDYHC